MRKAKLIAISIIFFVIFIIGLTGCASIKDKSKIPEVMPMKPISSSSGDNVKAIDYNHYLKKIWVVKSWNGGAYDSFSFFISRIENGIIEGKLSTGSIAYPDFYFYSLEPSKKSGDLSGIVNNGVAECQFSDKVRNKGNVTLIFKENDEIEAKIKYMDKGEAYEDLPLDGNYLFRPYHLSDIKDFIPFKEHSFSIDLNSWGSVNFISGEVNHGDKVYPAAYLTNEHDDILYKFQASFKTGSELLEASIKDINNDGLKDVVITTGFIDDPDAGRIEWIFYQMSDGLFCDSELNGNK
ncbi:hypothetical protein [Phosphitispora sp. TUW77]|uniref:hypothetical protein n=1 Tax=Phosphitispora sp. TUW77 TaxID=3152361 RepID=UPI003AB2CE07